MKIKGILSILIIFCFVSNIAFAEGPTKSENNNPSSNQIEVKKPIVGINRPNRFTNTLIGSFYGLVAGYSLAMGGNLEGFYYVFGGTILGGIFGCQQTKKPTSNAVTDIDREKTLMNGFNVSIFSGLLYYYGGVEVYYPLSDTFYLGLQLQKRHYAFLFQYLWVFSISAKLRYRAITIGEKIEILPYVSCGIYDGGDSDKGFATGVELRNDISSQWALLLGLNMEFYNYSSNIPVILMPYGRLNFKFE